MTLGPDRRARLARVLSDLRLGVPVIVEGSAGPMGVAAAETTPPDQIAALRGIATAHLTVTARRAEVLKARVYDGDLARLEIHSDASAAWIRSIADPSRDLANPLRGPFNSLRGGSVDADRAALRLCKMARILPAALLVPLTHASPDLLTVTAEDILADDGLDALHPVIAARVPIADAAGTRVHVFADGTDFAEHYAVEIGQPPRDRPVLCRIHSACFTGDVLGSLKCDCGAQLDAALKAMASGGEGVLLYLNQEGRGIGLANKLRAYALQDQGFDTVDANHRLGFEDDERDFRIGANILTQMGFTSARLMTNNPRKSTQMETAGITVTERVPHHWGERAENAAYLATKQKRSGHLS